MSRLAVQVYASLLPLRIGIRSSVFSLSLQEKFLRLMGAFRLLSGDEGEGLDGDLGAAA